jgi:hypothetical protein
MILLGLAMSGCGSLNEVPSRDTPGVVEADSGTQTDSADTSDITDTDTDTFVADPDAPVIATCDAYCWYHTTGEQFYEWGIECSATDPDGFKDIWNGRWGCTDGACEDQSGLIACTATAGQCSTSFKESQIHPTILCEQAASYTFTVWVSDWQGHESKGFKVSGRQQ